MRITIPIFKGMRPILASHLLDAGESQVATNVDIDSGELRAMSKPLKISDLAGTSIDTLGRWTENSTKHWLEFSVDVDLCKGPVADDSYERIYFTGLSQPRFFANDNITQAGSPPAPAFNQDTDYIKLGVPAPAGALAGSGYSTGSSYRAYVYTWVNRYGEEGPPSPLLEISNYASGNVTLTGFDDPESGRAIESIRLYRINSSAAELAEFQLVFSTDIKIYDAADTYMSGDIVMYDEDLFKCVQNNTNGVTPVGSASEWDDWYDGIADADLQPDTLVSEDWEPPPAALKGLCAMANGVLAGFVGSTLYQCEPYYPHAWPQGTYTDDFRVQLPYPIVALKAPGGSLIALTTGPAYLISGSQPDQMSPIKLPGEVLPCISKKSASESDMGILYATHVGLAAAAHDGVTLVSAGMLDKNDWTALSPSTIHGVFYDGKYIGCHNDEAVFILDFERKSYTQLNFDIYATMRGDDDGVLYIVRQEETDPNNPPATPQLLVMEWAGSESETLYYEWKSGLLIAPASVNFGAGRVTIDEAYAAAVEDSSADVAEIIAYNATLFAAGIDGGLAAHGLNVYGINGDGLRSALNLSIGDTVTFKWYADGVLKHSKVVSTSDPFRLPAGFRAKRFEIGLEGYVPVRKVEVAGGMEELYGE